MRKTTFMIQSTLDGFIYHTEMIADEETHKYATDLMETGDILVYGRITYQLMESYWPTAANDKSLPEEVIEFANKLNPMPKIVFSKTLENVGWNTRIIRSDPVEEVKRLKRKKAKIY